MCMKKFMKGICVRESVTVQDPKHCSVSLVQLLLGQLTSPNVAPITRSAAAAYMASFLARAALVPEHILIESLQVRCPCLQNHLLCFDVCPHPTRLSLAVLPPQDCRYNGTPAPAAVVHTFADWEHAQDLPPGHARCHGEISGGQES